MCKERTNVRDYPLLKIHSNKREEYTPRRIKINQEGIFTRTYNVFNLDQCEGIDKDSDILTITPRISSCENVYANYPEAKPEVNLGLKTMYIPALDQIRIPEVGNFHSTSDYYVTT